MSTDNLLDKIMAQSKLSIKETSKQQKIVEVAISMFAEKGYSNTSTNEIAKAAGVSEGTIFRHYGTKENLLISVILPFLKDLFPILAEEFFKEIDQNFGCFEDFLRAAINNRFNFIKSNKEIFQVVIKEFLYREELPNRLIPHFKTHALDFFNKTLNTFKARGEIIDIPNTTILRMMLASILGYFTMRFILLPENININDANEIECLVSFISKGLKK